MVVILFTDTTSYINSTTIIISERCSSTYSMAIGGTATPSDLNTYNLNLLQSELSSLHSKNIIFDSYNGTIFISGFDQSPQNSTNSKIIMV